MSKILSKPAIVDEKRARQDILSHKLALSLEKEKEKIGVIYTNFGASQRAATDARTRHTNDHGRVENG